MKFAIIADGGKQYRVKEGGSLALEKIDKKEGSKVAFKDVLLYSDGKQTVIGTPRCAGAAVTGSIVGQGRDKKVTVIKYKRKTRYKRTIGHRQMRTRVKIDTISVPVQ
ncbi:MAG: 50S ribosomal protein L21 [Patescibacteria group bacterium]